MSIFAFIIYLFLAFMTVTIVPIIGIICFILYKFRHAIHTKESIWFNAGIFEISNNDYSVIVTDIDDIHKIVKYKIPDETHEVNIKTEAFADFFQRFIPESVYKNKIYRVFSKFSAMKIFF